MSARKSKPRKIVSVHLSFQYINCARLQHSGFELAMQRFVRVGRVAFFFFFSVRHSCFVITNFSITGRLWRGKGDVFIFSCTYTCACHVKSIGVKYLERREGRVVCDGGFEPLERF